MGKTFLKFSRKHHFAEMCRSKSVKEFVQGGERDDEQFFVDTLYIGNIEKSDEWPAIMKCKESGVKMKLDTGEATNVTPLNMFRKITKKPQIKPSNTMLKAHGGHRVTHIGKCHLTWAVNDHQELCDFYIVDSKSPPILGLTACGNLGLITSGMNDVEAVTTKSVNTTYKDVCTGLGCFKELDHI